MAKFKCLFLPRAKMYFCYHSPVIILLPKIATGMKGEGRGWDDCYVTVHLLAQSCCERRDHRERWFCRRPTRKWQACPTLQWAGPVAPNSLSGIIQTTLLSLYPIPLPVLSSWAASANRLWLGPLFVHQPLIIKTKTYLLPSNSTWQVKSSKKHWEVLMHYLISWLITSSDQIFSNHSSIRC